MSFDDFKRNLRGVNENADFPPDYLVCLCSLLHKSFHLTTLILKQGIYENIRKREIIMPEEHTGQAGFDYAWKELLQRSRTAGEYPLGRSLSRILLTTLVSRAPCCLQHPII